ncbi:hypothetical protein DFQ27_007344 [Actinomortierella ambigua]|uniref:Uncharacterized protein n=1 Tax=Actinomortierella ambigua TaxID=1343610 RepID=A0A9P6PV05_9FUNG|nr:hypothetical protein DFQ27_007344 [Actinomortierella ambigua]
MSFGYTWFSTTFNIVCDRQDTSPLCTLRIKTSGSNGQSSLGEKSLKLWKLVSRSSGGGGGGDGGSAATAAVTAVATTANIIVKLDDETIIQKHVLDEFIDDFARKPCIVAGIPHNSNNNNNGGDGRYWPLSKLYMFKKSALPPVDSPLWLAKSGRQFMNAEHVQMAHLINVTDPALVCQIDTSKFWHGDFDESTKGWDMRVELKFRYLSSSSC